MPKAERCAWARHELEIAYHDSEWGVPLRDSEELFAKLILDGFQAGLSWLTILKKRESFYSAFDNFDPQQIARYGEKDRVRLLADSGIIRNRQKIDATIGNARAYLRLRDEEGIDFGKYLWGFVDGRPVLNRWKEMGEIPAQSELSLRISKDLLKRGFKFVGPTIVYAFMQAVGLVNDHVVACPRHKEVQKQLD